jgi:hypothetical protein
MFARIEYRFGRFYGEIADERANFKGLIAHQHSSLPMQ